MEQYETPTLEALLRADQGFYFNNLFAKMRFLNPTVKLGNFVSPAILNRNLHLVLKSLRSYAPKLLGDKKIIYDLLTLCISNIDHSIMQSD